MKGVNLGLKVMKRLFVVFLVLGALMSVEAWGAAETKLEQSPAESMSSKRGFVEKTYTMLIDFAFDLTKKLISKSYKSLKTIFNNVISILLATIAFFWLFSHLKNGTISREEVFKALIFVIVFVIVYVLLNSKAAFDEFVQVFYIPKHLVASALALSDGNNVAQQINNAFVKPFVILSQIPGVVIDYYLGQHSWYEIIDKSTSLLFGALSGGITALIFAIYIICNLIVVVAVIIIHMYSTFLSGIYIAFLPIMIPLLLIPQTKSIFFAWVKSFVGITMYVPLSMIPLSIINKISVMIGTSSLDYIVPKLFFFTLLGMISCIIAILLLQKIPTWISELLGVANQGVGMGGALGMLKTAGMGVGSAMMGYGGGLVKNLSSSFGKGASSGIKSSLANLATGGLYGGAAESAKSLGSLMKNGFKSTANYFKGKGFKPDTNK